MKHKPAKYILSFFPKWLKWMIGIVFSALLTYLIVQLFTGSTILISALNTFKILVGVLVLTVFGFLWAAIKSVSKLLNCGQKKILHQSEVSIGVCNVDDFGVDIFASIILEEKDQPSVSTFLNRMRVSEPYCIRCQRPLSFIICEEYDEEPDGYMCRDCGRRICFKNEETFRKDAIADVRKNYDRYWQKYHEEIDKLTGGKPEDYEVPSALGVYTSGMVK